MKKFISLQYKFFFYFLLLSILPVLAVGILSYYRFSEEIMKNAVGAHSQKLSSISSNIDGIMTHVNEISHLILQNQGIREYLSENIPADSSTMDFLAPFVGYDGNISSIYIQASDGRELLLGSSSAAHALTPELSSAIKKLDGYYLWYPNLPYMKLSGEEHFTTFSFSRLYKNIYHPNQALGHMTIDVPVSVIEKTYQNQLSYDSSIFLIVDAEGAILHCSNPAYLGEHFDVSAYESGKGSRIGKKPLSAEYLLTQTPIAETDWTAIDLTPVSELLSGNKTISTVLFTAMLFCIFFCIVLASFISRRYLAPLRSLCELMQDAGQQKFKKYPGNLSNDEVGVLASKFNSMSDELETLIHQVYASRISQREAELNSLQAQINPHFLYNTLDTIYWVCRLENAPDAAELIRALGDLFRLNLNNGSGIISLEDELKHLNCYLVIQKKRMKDSVEVILDVDSSPELLKARVIKLVLQPLVENAFLHGTSQTNEKNTIKITIAQKEGCVFYTVEDNGSGINSEILKQLKQPGSTVGFGLRNVNERIQLSFGEAYGIHISSTPGKGTVITVVQPFITEIEEGKELPNA